MTFVPWRWPLHWQILLGLLLGAAAGLAVGMHAVSSIPDDVPAEARGRAGAALATGTAAFAVFELGGDLFLNGLRLIIVPLVTTSIILAVAGVTGRAGGGNDFARLSVKTLGFYLATSTVAVVIGLVVVNTVTPGVVGGEPILATGDLSAFADARSEVDARVGGKSGGDFLDVFRLMVPPNLLAAAAADQLLGLIVVSMLVGYFLTRVTRLHPESGRAVNYFIDGVYHLTLMVTNVVLRVAPVGVFFLIAGTFARQFAGLYPDGRFEQFLTGIALFAATALGALALHFLGVMPLVLALVARVNPWRHYKAMAPALVTAFSTSSSAATLPLTLDCVENRAGVSNKVAGFTIPLGATVNMDGTALYECVAAVFICQAFGIELSFTQQFVIVLTALLTSVGVAGVPSASLVAIAVILTGVENNLAARGIDVDLIAGMALLFVFDRPLDMCRTAVNVFGDSVAAVTIARSEGETGVLALPVEELVAAGAA